MFASFILVLSPRAFTHLAPHFNLVSPADFAFLSFHFALSFPSCLFQRVSQSICFIRWPWELNALQLMKRQANMTSKPKNQNFLINLQCKSSRNWNATSGGNPINYKNTSGSTDDNGKCLQGTQKKWCMAILFEMKKTMIITFPDAPPPISLSIYSSV